MAYLDNTGLAYFWGKIKAWANSVFALLGHTHPASDVTLMTGYSKPVSGSAVAASDTLNQAVGKLEAKVDDALDDSNYVHITGDETITGFKTVKADSKVGSAGKVSGLYLRHPDINRGDSSPAANAQCWLSIVFGDASGDLADRTAPNYGRLALVEAARETNRQFLLLSSYRPSLNSNDQSQIKLAYEYESSQNAGIPFCDINGCVRLTRTTDASGTSKNHPALVVGNEDGSHLELDTNEIMAKSDGTTPTELWINSDGGTTYVGGLLKALDKINVSGGLWGSAANGEMLLCADPNYDNRGGGKIVLRGSQKSSGAGTVLITAYSPALNKDSTLTVYPDKGIEVGRNLLAPYIHVYQVNPYLIFNEADIEKGVNGGTGWQGLRFSDKNGSTDTDALASKDTLAYIICNSRGTSGNHLEFAIYRPVSGSTDVCTLDFAYAGGSTDGTLCFYNSSHDNVVKLGIAAHRWSVVYAGTGSINTSDARLKSDVSNIPDTVLDAWDKVHWCQFRMNDAIAEKGDKARIHSGAIAQEIASVFESEGLDPSRYALYCYDKWDKREAQKNAKGETVVDEWPAGDRYSLRYEEALCMEAAYMRRENSRLKKRVADLEERLAALELKIS